MKTTDLPRKSDTKKINLLIETTKCVKLPNGSFSHRPVIEKVTATEKELSDRFNNIWLADKYGYTSKQANIKDLDPNVTYKVLGNTFFPQILSKQELTNFGNEVRKYM